MMPSSLRRKRLDLFMTNIIRNIRLKHFGANLYFDIRINCCGNSKRKSPNASVFLTMKLKTCFSHLTQNVLSWRHKCHSRQWYARRVWARLARLPRQAPHPRSLRLKPSSRARPSWRGWRRGPRLTSPASSLTLTRGTLNSPCCEPYCIRRRTSCKYE